MSALGNQLFAALERYRPDSYRAGKALEKRERWATIGFIELQAGLEERLRRNRLPDRLLEKPSKRDLAGSEASLRGLESLRMYSGGAIPFDDLLLVVDTEELTPEQVAERLIEELGLPCRSG
ncbi:MAG: hypothetical protein KDC10_12340 [Calditrichaeota bacterium]|nr:hypothetical protein [Calditrichota bacterium]